MLGKIEARRRRGRQRMRQLDSITDSMDVSLSTLWEMVENRVRHDLVAKEQQQFRGEAGEGSKSLIPILKFLLL